MRQSPEFDRIRSVVEAIDAPEGSDVRIGPGDDAAVLLVDPAESVVISCDLSVEDVHFRREWLTWDAIGFRAVAAALSDLAAMAARPVGVLLSIAVPPEVDARTLDELARGVGSCLRQQAAPLLGGDLARSPGPVAIDVTVVGAAGDPIERSGAQPGDELWVTGRLGAAALAASAWSAGLEPDPAARRAFERPVPRIREARLLADLGDVHALIDLSDGLAGDAAQIAAASGVRLQLETDRIPLHRALEGWSDSTAALALAAGGGEDYELLLASAPGSMDEARARLEGELAVELTRVGQVAVGQGVIWLDQAGDEVAVPATGFDHFAGGG